MSKIFKLYIANEKIFVNSEVIIMHAFIENPRNFIYHQLGKRPTRRDKVLGRIISLYTKPFRSKPYCVHAGRSD